MKIILRIAVCVLLVFSSGVASARVEEETLCFQAATNEKLQLAFKYYLDTDLNEQLGAFVQYGPSKALITLVFLNDASSDETSDWELHWLEIVDGKPGGTYSLLKPKAATVAAAYLKYRSAKTGKETLFRPYQGPDGKCAIGAQRPMLR